jgi:hypothetical protein
VQLQPSLFLSLALVASPLFRFLHSLAAPNKMLADLDLALKSPLELVQQLYRAGGSSLDGFEEKVASNFTALFDDQKAREQGRSSPLPL